MPDAPILIRPVDTSTDDEVVRVATRMRATLMEVLGAERGEAMYELDWLVDRVRFHLDPARCTGAVFVADADGEVVGHTIVRVEDEEAAGVDGGTTVGLFSTTYVAPEGRRRGVADLLLGRGEAWMRDHGLDTAVTYTDPDNEPLIALYRERGYDLAPAGEDFVRLSHSL